VERDAARRRVPVRLLVALSVAAVLAVFLLYTSFAGGATESLRPSQLLAEGQTGETVQLAGVVVGPVSGDSRGAGLRFDLKDFDGKTNVPIVYTGTVPDLFRAGRHVYLQGELEGGVFVAKPDSLVTKCPSKYAPKQSDTRGTPT
jgi:cytochrome c-type biogenesis protein CcmE